MGRLFAVLGATCCACLCVPGCRSRDEGKAPGSRTAVVASLDKSAVLATIADEQTPPASASPSGLGLHPTAPATTPEFFFSEHGGGVAWVAEKDGKFQVIHNGRASRPYAAVGTIALTADGRRCAHGALVDGKWRMVVDGTEGESFSAVNEPVFSPDGAHVAYQAMSGERWHLVVDSRVNGGTPNRYLQHGFSSDSSSLAFIEATGEEGGGTLIVSDLGFKRQKVIDSHVSSFLLNADKSRVAAISMRDGRPEVLTFAFERPEQFKRGSMQDDVYRLTFGPDGSAFAYVSWRSGSSFIVLNDKEASLPPGGMVAPPAIRPDGQAVGALVAADGAVRLRQFFVQGGQSEATYDEGEGLVYDGDGRSLAFAARKGASWLLVVNGREGPPFDRVVTPVFSPDGKRVVYRARKDGKRFVVVADTRGKTIRQHPAYEQVFPVLFTADGKSVAYGVKDGPQLAWKVEAL